MATASAAKAGTSSNDAKISAKEAPVSTPTPAAQSAATVAAKSAPTGPKGGRIVPAVPLQSPVTTKTPLQPNAGNMAKGPAAQTSTSANRSAVEDATQAAAAAVAAAMAKMGPVGGAQTNGNSAVDNLTRKVNEMRTTEPIRAPRQPGAGGFGGQRGRGRGGPRQETRKIEVPETPFDFESSNAKFNKQDLVKEAISGSPLTENPPNGDADEGESDVVIPNPSYNKKSSFFDDLSSETKDRAEGDGSGRRPGGREWRGEEQKKNMETFGQGTVDNGYRGGFRGRGRGRGGMRGRGNYGGNGQPGRGRGGYRGGRDETAA